LTDPLETEERNGLTGARLWGYQTYLSLAATSVVLALLVSQVDLPEVWRQVVASDKHYLFLAALSHYATYPVRGARWRLCIRHVPCRCGSGRFAVLAFFFLFVDNLVPAKLGDFYGAHLARINCGVRRSVALGSIVFQRTVDAWIVLFLAAAASWRLFSTGLPGPVFWALALAGLFTVAVTAVLVVFSVLNKALPTFVPESFRQRIAAFREGMLPERAEIVPVLFLSAIIWSLESLWIFLLLRAFGLQEGALEAVFLMAIPVIASVFPFTPSGAGAVELSLFGSLRLIGIASPLAVSVTIVNRFIDYWLHIVLGTLVWLLRRKIGLQTWKDVPERGGDPLGVAGMLVAGFTLFGLPQLL
jgi:uncharacterized protein (TIRG00374 family)